MNKIYLEGNEEDIKEIFRIARTKIGNGITILDIKPELKEEEKDIEDPEAYCIYCGNKIVPSQRHYCDKQPKQKTIEVFGIKIGRIFDN